MIDLIAAAGIGGIIGFGTCAVLTMGRVADSAANEEMLEVMTRRGVAVALELVETEDAHTRCSDALETARNRIERALEQITPGSNATVKRIARILRGEQG